MCSNWVLAPSGFAKDPADPRQLPAQLPVMLGNWILACSACSSIMWGCQHIAVAAWLNGFEHAHTCTK